MKKNTINHMDIESLVSELQLKDSKYKKIMRRFQIIFFIFIFFYAGFFLVNPDPDISTNERLAGGCYVVAFMLFTYYYRKSYKKYKELNYFEPVKTVLEEAEKRYRLWQPKSLIIVVGFIILGAGSFLNSFNDNFTFMQIFIGVLSIYILAFGIGITIGYFVWIKESKPIWLSAKKILKELEE